MHSYCSPRRPLLLASYVTMAGAMLLLALLLLLPHLLPALLAVLSINLFYLGFAIGQSVTQAVTVPTSLPNTQDVLPSRVSSSARSSRWRPR